MFVKLKHACNGGGNREQIYVIEQKGILLVIFIKLHTRLFADEFVDTVVNY